MATNVILNNFKTTIQALAEKYQVPATEVRYILQEIPDQILTKLDWKDLDAVVQEALVEGNYSHEEFEEGEEEVIGGFPRYGQE